MTDAAASGGKGRWRPERYPASRRDVGLGPGLVTPLMKSSPGFSISEMILAVFLVFALIFGVVLMLTWESGDLDSPGGNPYRAQYAGYIHDRLLGWQSAVVSFQGMTGSLPGDSNKPLTTNANGDLIGNGNGRVEKEIGENLKFFSDLYAMGLSSEPQVRVRGQVMDFYWCDFSQNGSTARPDNYFKLPNINADEAKSMDYRYDDGNRSSGDLLYFPNPDGSVDLFSRFKPF